MEGRNAAPTRGRGRGDGRQTPSRSSSSQSQSNASSSTRSRGGGGPGGSFQHRSFQHRSPSYKQGRGGGPGTGNNHSAFSSGQVFGSGTGTVVFEKDKEKDIWKVGPPQGQRYQLKAFLRELTAFVAWKQRTQYQPPIGQTPSRNEGRSAANQREDVSLPTIDRETVESTTPSRCQSQSLSGAEYFESLSSGTVASSWPIESLIVGQEGCDNSEEVEDTARSMVDVDSSPLHRLVAGGEAEVNSTSFFNQPPDDAELEDIEIKTLETALTTVTIHEGDDKNAKRSRQWFPSNLALEAAAAAGPKAVEVEPLQPIKLSIRLERRDITDREVEMLADWAYAHSGSAEISKLWLFQGRIGDEGAQHVARMLTEKTKEVHLSHNMLTLQGALSLLTSIPATPPSAHPLWLRLEWNRVSLSGLVSSLEALHGDKGLLVDIPEVAKADAAPPLPTLPLYLASAREGAPPASPGGVGARGARNALRPLLTKCHVRMPWVSCQYELPEEATVLQDAKGLWRGVDGVGGIEAGALGSTSGPLLLILDTSALLPMIKADPKMTTPTPFTLDLLLSLAEKGLFGRSLAPAEQVFLVVPDSVVKQLDSLKADPGARTSVRWFMSSGLDSCGPAGWNFLTVLGAHEGEGLVLENEAELAGSRGHDVAGPSQKGQATDVKIVEVALFFQNEILHNKRLGGSKNESSHPLAVLLLSGDNVQLNVAKAHGLPAVRMADLKRLLTVHLESCATQNKPLNASVLRGLLREEAVKGLGAVAAKSIHFCFDQAVASLQGATDLLVAQQQIINKFKPMMEVLKDEGGSIDASAILESIDQLQGSDAVVALQMQLTEWEELVTSHRSSRVMQWTTTQSKT